MEILAAYPFLVAKYVRLTGGADLVADLRAAAEDHDLGKATPQWQSACRADYEVYRAWRQSQGLDPDGVDRHAYVKFEAFAKTSPAGRPTALMRAKLRHELASLERMRKGNNGYVTTAIAAHHGKLAMRHEHRWLEDGRTSESGEGPYYRHWKQFKCADDRNDGARADAVDLPAVLRKRYRYDAVRALLQLADTRASRMESKGREALASLQAWAIDWPHQLPDGRPSYRPVQRRALEMAEADDYVQILRAPTGSGKTGAAMLWANRQVERGRADRLVVAMPTRFTANAVSQDANKMMTGETGLYHSTAFYTRFGEATGAAMEQAKETHALAQKLVTPTTVCTIDHLLLALTGVREAHHATFFFLANAAVVLDEADFYDAFVQANLKFLLDALRALEVPVLIMSATVPESAREYYGVSTPIEDVDRDEAKERTPPVRRVRYGGEVQHPADQRVVLTEMLQRGNGIVYANTVARAIAYRRYLRELQSEIDPSRAVEIILYHSRFTEPHKVAKEKRLKAALGPQAWEAGKVRAIAVLTQIGEMSINISTGLMLSEVCPWDRLSQRLGRLNRFYLQQDATCVVVAPMKDGALYPAPYGEFVRGKGWSPSEPQRRTVEHLREIGAGGQAVTPIEMTGYVNELYRELEALSPLARANRKAYERLVRSTVLILPDLRGDDETGEADDWSARHIGPQQTVLTLVPPGLHVANWSDWQAWKLEYGLEVPVYLIKKDARQTSPRLSRAPVLIGYQDEPDQVEIYHTPQSSDNDAVLAGGAHDVYTAELGLSGLFDEPPPTEGDIDDDD